jgi:hypothetical protein
VSLTSADSVLSRLILTMCLSSSLSESLDEVNTDIVAQRTERIMIARGELRCTYLPSYYSLNLAPKTKRLGARNMRGLLVIVGPTFCRMHAVCTHAHQKEKAPTSV